MARPRVTQADAVLDAAALTYVAAAAAAVMNLLYWINVVSGRSRRIIQILQEQSAGIVAEQSEKAAH